MAAPNRGHGSSLSNASVSIRQGGLSRDEGLAQGELACCGKMAAALLERSELSLIDTAKMNDVDPQAWRADVLTRIAEHPVHGLDELLPWNWRD